MKDNYAVVRDALMKHVGAKNPISSKHIGQLVGIKEDDTRFRSRKLIKEVAEYYCLPILSCKNGYYLASNLSELEKYNSEIDKRIIGMMRRKNTVNKNFGAYMKKGA